MRKTIHRQNRRRATFESLEDRLLLAAHLLADVNSTLLDIEPRNLTAVGDTTFFFAQGGLWKTDGTSAGTNLVREVKFEPWRTDEMAAVGNKLVFVGTDDEHGAEVWISDGTTEGTQLLRDFNIGPDDGILDVLDGDTFLAVGDQLYFRTQDDIGQSLWRTDGTLDGTEMVVTIEQKFFSTSMISLNGEVYFATNRGGLWKSDGTAAGTVRIATKLSLIEMEAASDRHVFFSKLESFSFLPPFDADFTLWRTDGTEAGTQRLHSIERVDGVTLDNRFFYPQREAEQLWQSDGTMAGTKLVTTIPHLSAVVGTLNGRILVGVNRSLESTPIAMAQIFGVPGSIANELWSYDAETDSLELIADDWKYFGPPDVWKLQDEVFFIRNGDVWKTDGTQPGTVLVQEGVAPTKVVSLGDGLVLDNDGSQLWTSDGSPGTTEQIPLDIGLTEDSMPRPVPLGVPAFQEIGNTTLFIANDQLWRTDGTEAGTQSIQTWNTFGARFIAAPLQRHAVFELDLQDENEIWISDGTTTGTRRVGNGRFFVPMLQTEDDIYFRTTNGGLWRLDSGFNLVPVISLANTRGPTLYSDVVNNKLVMQSTSVECVESDCIWALDIRSIELGTSEVQLVARFENAKRQRAERFVKLGDQLVFVAADAAHGQELWSTDGTTEGTQILIETSPGGASKSPKNLMPLVDSVVFETADIAGNGTLWRTNGTAAGTSVIATDFVSRSKREFRLIDGRLVFIGQDQAANTELWLTDGSRSGTRIVDIYVGEKSSIPEFLTEMDGIVYFSADDGIHGRELWATDGTVRNTRLVQDINPGSEGSAPAIVPTGHSSFLNKFVKDPIGKSSQHEGELFFAATTEEFGRELWKTNGSDEGTVMVVDFVAGSDGSSPHSMTFVNDKLFLAVDGDLGFEPWVYATGANPLPGDADGDGEVSFSDFLILSANFGKQDQAFPDGDFDGDGSVAFTDFLLLSAYIGQRRISIGDHVAATDHAFAGL